MKARILCIAMFTLLCASCGSSGGPSSAPAPNASVQVPGLMRTGRFAPAVTLKSGIVLEVGGLGSLAGVNLASGEVYDPKSGLFTLVANQLPIGARSLCIAALSDGTALEAGGIDSSANALSQAEIYDPVRNRFAPAKGPLNQARFGCTATTLQDGTVLIAGGFDKTGTTDTAEIYDPASGTFSSTTGSMKTPHAFHAAVLLADGKVLLAGGLNGTTLLASAELYDPVSETFSATAGPLNSARDDFAAIPLADGRALLAGGAGASSSLDSAELYDPASSTFSFTTNNMSIGRWMPSAAPLADGNAIVGAGSSAFPSASPEVASVDLFDASTNTFSPTGALHIARMGAAAVVLPGGAPLILGGEDDQGNNGGNSEPSGEIYNPTTGTFTVTGGLNALRVAYASAMLPDGRVLIAGGGNETAALDTAEVFDPKTRHFAPTANNLEAPCAPCNGVTLTDGMVLIVDGGSSSAADLFDPKTTSFSPTSGPMVASRPAATANLLGDGTVLIAGGLDASDNALDTAELYNPVTGTFSAANGTMVSPRANHTATLLANGKLLLAGGSTTADTSHALATAEIYDPKTGMFTAAPNTMTSARDGATANLLESGQVLITGGANAGGNLATAELFNPKTGNFTPTAGAMNSDRAWHSSVYLPDGRIMIAGGGINTPAAGAMTTATVDFYDPATGRFQAGAPMLSPREFFTITFLYSGKVLIPGGLIDTTTIGMAALETAELYTP